MAAAGKGGVFLLLLLLLLLCFLSSWPSYSSFHLFAAADSDQLLERDGGAAPDPPPLPDRQDAQLDKLESLVHNLSEAVARLESSLAALSQVSGGDGRRPRDEERSDRATLVGRGSSPDSADGGDLGAGGEKRPSARGREVGGRRRGITVTKYKPSWSERFQFLSAVKLESEATCVNVLPYEDHEKASKYVAVGDEKGRVFIVLSNGDVLVEFDTLSHSPITSMLSYMSLWKNETLLITGHQDGSVLGHRVWEATAGAAVGDDWSSLAMAHWRTFFNAADGSSERTGDGSSFSSPVVILEVHMVGRTKFILSADANGKIRVFQENGTMLGSATSLSRPLVFLKQRLLFLTESGAGSLDLRGMKVKESECEGLNGSTVTNYVFDASERSKAYGFTSDGDLIQVVLLGDATNFKCMVRAKRKSDMEGPLSVNSIKGYLLVVSKEKVFVYNVSSPHYIRVGVPRPLFFVTIDEIKTSFLSTDAEIEVAGPLVSSDREKLVVLGLGSGYVGLYRSGLPVFKAEFNTVLWSSPVVICILFLIGAWQFFGKKKEVLTSWGSDDPFGNPAMGAGASSTMVPGSGERAGTYTDSSRPGDLRDMRGGGLRGPPRRYGSPTRYPGGAASSFRPTTSATSDPNFRTTAELKYRGQNLDMSGFPKRREPLFQSNQNVDDSTTIE